MEDWKSGFYAAVAEYLRNTWHLAVDEVTAVESYVDGEGCCKYCWQEVVAHSIIYRVGTESKSKAFYGDLEELFEAITPRA